MANLNLSEFTEKLFVADADHTFIWDTANAISKRVSRNSWLNSGTLTSDAPVTISQTWGTTGTYTAVKVNVTETATANALSKLLDLQVGTVTKFAVFKDGTVQTTLISTNGVGALNLQYGATGKINCFTDLDVLATNRIAFLDTFLQRDGAANTLALRNGANGQTFSVYGTYPGAAWERFTITAPTSGNVLLGTYKGTGGIARGLEFQTDGVTRMTIAAAGGISTASWFDCTELRVDGSEVFNTTGATLLIGTGGFSGLNLGLGNVILRIGGTTNLFPALKRSSTTLQAVLANDSGFTNIQGKLTTDTAFTATTVTPTGFITLYDSTGTAYKVPCVPA